MRTLGDMNPHAVMATMLAAALLLAACNVTGLSNNPRATFSQIACLDKNEDGRINDADAADPSKLPDFNADGDRDEDDAAFVRGVDIALNPDVDACSGKQEPEYAVAHDYFASSDVNCADGTKAVLLLGVGGGRVNLREKTDAAGIRKIIDALHKAYDDRNVKTINVLAGPAVEGAQNAHSAMEQWLTHATRVYLDRFPCARLVAVGHSFGGVTADVVGARLEGEYAGRIIAIVDVDRVEALYQGDTGSRPQQAPVFNIYETNDPVLRGKPYDSPNAENWDASGERGPSNGEQGGEQEPVRHTTIDNSEPVRERIVDEVMERS